MDVIIIYLKNVILIPNTPFVTGTFIQDYLGNIQNYRYLVKDNEKIRKEALNNTKDKK